MERQRSIVQALAGGERGMDQKVVGAKSGIVQKFVFINEFIGYYFKRPVIRKI
jgi:hypothetical protein